MSLIGAIRVVMGLETANYESSLRRVGSRTRGQTQEMERSFLRFSQSGVRAFSTLRTGILGLGAALAGNALFQQARGALEWASGLSETAQQIGVTVEQLQIMRLAADQNGASVEGMQRAVAILNRTLGQAKAGLPAAVQAFRNVGISQEQLRNLQSAGEAFPLVAEGISRFGSEAEQAAAAQALFGRGAAELLPILEQGRAGWDAATEAAIRNGLVTEEQARTADAASDQLSALGSAIRVDLVNAIGDALPGLVALGRMLGWVLGIVIRLVGWVFSLIGALANLFARSALLDVVNTGASGRPAGTVLGAIATGRAGGMAGIAGPAAPGGAHLSLGGGGGGRGGGAHHQRDDTARRAQQFQQESLRLSMDELRARREHVDDLDERLAIDQQIAALEHKQWLAEKQYAVSQGELTNAQYEQLLAKQRNVWREEQIGLNLDHTRAGEEIEAQIAEQQNDAQIATLRAQSELATTMDERRRIELEILRITYQHRRQALELVRDQRPGSAEAQRAASELADLPGRQRAETQTTLRNTMGPLESFLSGIPRTAAQANEALQSIAVEGLRNLTSGLAQSLASVRSLGDAFKALKNVAMNALSSILEMMLQRGLMSLLSRFMPGLGGSFSNAGTQSLLMTPGFAGGGSFNIGGMGGIDRNTLSLNGNPIARVSKGERLSIGAGGQRSGSPIVFDLRGAVMTQDLLRQMNDISAGHIGAAAPHIASAGAAMANERLMRRAGRRLGR